MKRVFPAAALLPWLALAAGGCGTPPPPAPAPLGPEDRGLLQRAERLLLEDSPQWPAAWAELQARPAAAQTFLRGLLAWLVEDFGRLGMDPETFCEELGRAPRGARYRRVLQGLAAVGPPAVELAMKYLAEGRDSFARGMGAQILGHLGPAALPPLAAGLAGGDARLAVGCARALGFHRGSAEAGRALQAAARGHRDYGVRGEALHALGRLGGPEARALLVAALTAEPDPFAVRRAVAGLEALGQVEAVPALVEYLERRKTAADAAGVQAAGKALRTLSGRNFGSRTDLWRAWWAERAAGGGGGERRDG